MCAGVKGLAVHLQLVCFYMDSVVKPGMSLQYALNTDISIFRIGLKTKRPLIHLSIQSQRPSSRSAEPHLHMFKSRCDFYRIL